MENLDKNTIEQEQEIDLIELAKKLLENWRFILKVCAIGLVVGIVVAFSIPKEYETKVILAPETNSAQSGNIGTLAAMAGINLQQNTGSELSPQLYPDIVSSTPFLLGLFKVEVKDSKKNIDMSLYTYLSEKQKAAWWSYIMSAPFKLIGLFSSKKAENTVVRDTIDSRVITLSNMQQGILGALKSRINVSVNKSTGVISLSSTMQSAEISAAVADTVISYMQKYIIGYRTQKARKDLDYTAQLYNEAQKNYYDAQSNLSKYMDENQGIVLARYRNTQERLQNEANVAFGVYNQMAQQLQMAKMKVQDTTPVYTIIQPAVVPLGAASPKKMLILIGFGFLAFVGACGWILVKDSSIFSNK